MVEILRLSVPSIWEKKMRKMFPKLELSETAQPAAIGVAAISDESDGLFASFQPPAKRLVLQESHCSLESHMSHASHHSHHSHNSGF